MPISLALRGRHADDAAAGGAGRACVAVAPEVDRVFSTYRADSHVSRLGRGEIALDECPAGGRARCSRWASRRGASPTARSTYDVPARTAPPRPERRGQGLGGERAAAHLAALADTDFCLSAGGDMVCRVAAPAAARGGSGSRTRTTRPGGRRRPGPQRRRRHLGACPPRVRTSSTPAPARARPAVASVTVVATDLTWADIDATAAFALGPTPSSLAAHPARTARGLVVVQHDGTTTPSTEIFWRPGLTAGTARDIVARPEVFETPTF